MNDKSTSMGKAARMNISAGMAAAITWFGYHCGSGFATGRQIVQYTTRHGWRGLWIPIFIWAALALYFYSAIEFAYLTRSKNYRDFNKNFYHPLGSIVTIVWDCIVMLASFVGLGSVVATAGELLLSSFGLNYWLGVIGFALLLCFFVVWGYNAITKVGSAVTFPMIVLIAIIVIAGIIHNWDNLMQVLSAHEVPEGSTIWGMFRDGMTYIGTQAGYVPAYIAISFGFTRYRDVKVATFFGAFLNFLMHFFMVILVLSCYPWVNDQSLVVLAIVNATPYPILTIFYQIILFLALVSTGVTMVYGGMSRFSVYGKTLIADETVRKGAWAAFFLLGSVGISAFGLSAIVSSGYKLVGGLRIPVMVIPILVLGLWRVHQAKQRRIQSGKSLDNADLVDDASENA